MKNPLASQKEVPLPDELINPLTDRQIQVLKLLAEGKTVKEIGTLLSISSKTAECHRTKIQLKLRKYLEDTSLVHLSLYAGAIGLTENIYRLRPDKH